MELLAKIMFLVGALPAIGGVMILVALAPQPRSLEEHLQGLARYLMLGGAAFGAVQVITGWAPPIAMVMLMIGVGLGIAIYARRNNLLALAAEKFDEGQESGT